MSIEELTQEIQSHYQRIVQAKASAQYWYDHYLDETKARYQQQMEEIRRQMQVSYRWATLPWDAPDWHEFAPDPKSPIPTAVRVGRFAPQNKEVDLGDLPSLVPFIQKGHLFITGEGQTAALQNIALRLIVSMPPGKLRFALVDPVGFGSNLAAFNRLPDTLRGDKIYVKPREIEQQLEELGRHIEEVIQTRLLNLYASIEEYNEQSGEIAVPYQVLLLVDFPAAFDDRMAEALLHIARNGPRAGVYIVASISNTHKPPREFKLTDLTSSGTILTTSTGGIAWNDPALSQYQILADTLPTSTGMNRWLDTVGDVAQQAPIHLDFARVMLPESEWWTHSAADGLVVPIAMNSTGEIHNLTLGQGVVHHALVGGIIQSGKTNLLHVLITQLALHYHPEEVEIYLIDFKEGVEFADYMNFKLPHARVVGLESEREFGLNVLRHLRNRMEERGRTFKKAGASRLSDFRRRSNDPMPRVLIVLDEFQVLFVEDDRLSQEAGQLLEDIARRGAAFGFHLFLNSQSPSGGPAYGRRLYDQMALRIALQCRSIDAQAILGEGNDAATQLEKVGEAIYNDDRGLPERNTFIRVAFLPAEQRHEVLRKIQELGQSRQYVPDTPTVSFDGRAPANLLANADLEECLNDPNPPDHPPIVHAWLGEPIEIKSTTAASFERYPASNLLIAGSDEAGARGLLLAALLSLAAQHPAGQACFMIADFARPGSPFANFFQDIQLPHVMSLAEVRTVQMNLAALTKVLDRRLSGDDGPEFYFFIVGLHRWRALRSTGGMYGDQSDVGKQLTRLADEGPDVGIHLVVWTDGLANVEQALKRGGLQYFDLRAALRVSEAESVGLFGSRIGSMLQDNRALFRHEDWELERVEKFKPYTSLDPESLGRLAQRIQQKWSQSE